MENDSARLLQITLAIDESLLNAVGDIDVTKMLNQLPKLSAVDFADDLDKNCDLHFTPPFELLKVRIASDSILTKCEKSASKKPTFCDFFAEIRDFGISYLVRH